MGDPAIGLFLALAAITLVSLGAGRLARRLGQPAVVGEIVAGILSGPTIAHGALSAALFSSQTRLMLTAVADIGVAMLMFAIGLEFEPEASRGSGRAVSGVVAGSLALPLAAGCGLGLLWSHGALSATVGGSTAGRTAFVLFIGVALSVTAFPVLVRILEDRDLIRTPTGRLAITSAALCDVIVWCLLGLVVFMAAGRAPARLAWLPVYLIVAVPVSRLLTQRTGRTGFALTLAGLLASCGATEWMGLHFIFGAFFFGLLVRLGRPGLDPGERRAAADRARRLRRDIEPVCVRLFMPVFFVVAGWQADLTGLGASGWLMLAAALAIGGAGKLLGAFGGAKLGGASTHQAAVIAALMNTRGLTELIVLTTGRQLGVLDTRQYTVLVIMAVVTTASTGPLLTALIGRAPALPPGDTDMQPAEGKIPATVS